MRQVKFFLSWVFLLGIGSASVLATTKGLNQIVTPDIQTLGSLSLSFQAQHQIIGNGIQGQYEYGFTKNFELAAFQGAKPGVEVLNMEYGLIQHDDWLLSCGFLNWSTAGDAPQPFVEAGYFKGKQRGMVGVQRVGRENQVIWGYGYQATKDMLLQADYLTGSTNFSTIGFAYNVNRRLQVNPAIYMANTRDHKLYPYVVFTYSLALR